MLCFHLATGLDHGVPQSDRLVTYMKGTCTGKNRTGKNRSIELILRNKENPFDSVLFNDSMTSLDYD